MKLEDWLTREGKRASAFARDVGVTPATISGLCRGDRWLGKDVAQKIYDATNGEVTPTDFMLIETDVAGAA
jgi:3,4-dihydroxy 2-butanone 4-phosphate synthase/GTP cyclohydrolase II